MLVYRIAHPDHLIEGYPAGPYASGDWPRESWKTDMGWAHANADHPTPVSDGYYSMQDEEFCAFDSTAALAKWFDGWLEEMHKSGYLQYVYDVPEYRVRAGGIQVLAELRCGSLVTTEPCISGEEGDQ